MSIKRIFDILSSLLMLLVATPILLLSALVIYLSDRGPIFFIQERIGAGAKPFKIVKFRTMTLRGVQGDSTVTTNRDPRVIRGARMLRAFKIDELPQLINVLRGEMSLVGPRPTVESDFLRMNEMQRRRFSMLPGLTGLAQISGNTALTWNDRIKYDLKYIDNWSLWLDIRIIFKTLFLVVTGKAETHPSGESEWEE
jgi:lipopolysaccharide/colanic/teichoic acid biosynthesis glycosyltransferase